MRPVRMFAPIWAALLLSASGGDANTGASTRQECPLGFCITLADGEITSEAGLCVVIPCSFTIGYGFTPQHLVWYKCEQSRTKCVNSDVIFHTNTGSPKIQERFKGRVSLLEYDGVSQGNCSIIVNDLTESDSGSYQLRVNGFQNGRPSGFTFPQRTSVSVRGLSQRPTVTVPPLTEGQWASLTCTAPGLCSGSAPEITWTWRRPGWNGVHVARRVETEELTAVTRRHSSTWSFIASANHHRTSISCKVTFTGNVVTEETVTLSLTYVKKVKITGRSEVAEGETLRLSCSVESFPRPLITWTKMPDALIDLRDNTETSVQEESSEATLSIPAVTAEHSGRYICTVKHLSETLVETVDVAVKYMRRPRITGETFVKEGDTLTLMCSVESFPPSNITWTSPGSNANGADASLTADAGSGFLVISNVTKEHSGRYICTAEHQMKTERAHADVTVAYVRRPRITGETFVKEGDTLTLTCSVESFPPSNITWTSPGSNANGADASLTGDAGSGFLVISNVTKEHSGRYICTAEHQMKTERAHADVTVAWLAVIANESGCVLLANVLKCVCITEGFPLPTVKWPLSQNLTEYSVTTSRSNDKVNSSITLTAEGYADAAVECVSGHQKGETRQNLIISILTEQNGQSDRATTYFKIKSWPGLAVAFVIGAIVAATFCGLSKICSRKKRKSSGHLDETMQMVTTLEEAQVAADQVVEDETHDGDMVKYGAGGVENGFPHLDGGSPDVAYATIDFSLLKRKTSPEATKRKESTETEYAEIKREKVERLENGSEQDETLQCKEEEEEEETKDAPEEVEEEEEADTAKLYCNVNIKKGERTE